MDECREQKSLEAFSQHDIIAELCQSVPENERQAFAEKLVGAMKLVTTLGAEPRAVGETTSTPSTAIVISSGVASNTDQTSQKMLKPGPSASVAPLNTIRPALKDLVCYAVPCIAAVWYDVGLQLDLEPYVLNEIDKERSDQPRRMFSKWLQGSSCSWQSVLDAVEKTCGAKPMEDIRAAVVESIKSAESAELTRKRRRSSTRSSEDDELQQSAAKKHLHDYMTLKMDLLAQDISDLRSESDPNEIIRLLYSNFLTVIAKLLKPHFTEVKIAADNHGQLGLHTEVVAQGAVASAESVDSLFSQMSVKRMWDKTRFFRKAVAAIPASAPERQAAEAILSHYNLHLAIYERATLLRDAKKSKEQEERTAPGEDTKLVPLKITSLKAFGSFTCEDCYCLQVRILSTAYGIPEKKIIYYDVEECQSTTVTFLIPGQFTHDIIQRSTQTPTVWILLEISVIEVSIPGVFTFSPSVDCFLTLLRGRKAFTVDFLRVTEVLPYQTYSLLDSDIKEPLSGRPLSTKRIEQHWDSHDEIGSRPPCSVPESEDDVILVMHSDDATISMESTGEVDESQSKVSELEAKVKDLERKVADLFMDNVALKTKLEAIRKVEKQQHEEITSLKERLVQALRAQETTTHKQSLSKTRESQLEATIEMLEATKSDLEKEMEKLHKQVMELMEIQSSDIGLLKEPSDTGHLVSKQSEVVPTTPSQKEEGQYEFIAQQEPNMEYQEAVTERTDKITEEIGEGSTGETQSSAEKQSAMLKKLDTFKGTLQNLHDRRAVAGLKSAVALCKESVTAQSVALQEDLEVIKKAFLRAVLEREEASQRAQQVFKDQARFESDTAKLREQVLKQAQKDYNSSQMVVEKLEKTVGEQAAKIDELEKKLKEAQAVEAGLWNKMEKQTTEMKKLKEDQAKSRQWHENTLLSAIDVLTEHHRTAFMDEAEATPHPINGPQDILSALDGRLDARWNHFGLYLGVDTYAMETIETHHKLSATDCMMHLVSQWMDHRYGTGVNPRTWETVVWAVKKTGLEGLAKELAKTYL